MRTDGFTGMMERLKAEHPKTALKVKYKCSSCQDTGFILKTDENGLDVASRCKCWAKELWRQSGILESFCEKSFEDFNTRNIPQLIKAKSKAEKYVTGFMEFERERYNSIMFIGQVGAGKTHLGVAICGELIKSGVPVVYMAYRNTVTKIKQNITDEAVYSRELKRYTSARVLYIDDLLKGRLTETDVNIMYEIVNYRYMNHMPVIISTEKSQGELIDFDEAVGSRILEMCRGNIITLQGSELNYRIYS